MKRIEILAGLLSQLDDINDAIRECMYTLEQNAEITRTAIREIMGIKEQTDGIPLDLNKLFQSLNDKSEKKKENEQKKGLNIFDEDFEEKIEEQNEKVTSKITKKSFMGPIGPIDVYEMRMGEEMTEEEIAKEITKHIKNINKMFDSNSKDEGEEDDEQFWA